MKPVIPFSVNPEWNIITRTILPVISQPAMFQGDERTNGIGDMVFTAFLSPAVPKGLIWGVGPVVQLPTDSNGLGNKNWGLGASFVVLKLEKGNPWVFGALVNNIWSLSGDQQGGTYSNGLIQPFINYNFPSGLYLTGAPAVAVNWKAGSGQQCTVPLGADVGKIFHIGKLPVNTRIGAYFNVVRPDTAPTGRSACRRS